MILILASLLLCGAGLILVLASGREKPVEKVDKNDTFDPLNARQAVWMPAPVTRYLNGLGLNLHPAITLFLIGALLSVTALWILLLETGMALLAVAVTLAITHLGLQALGNRYKKRLLKDLPSFLNQVSRRLSAGVSVEHAFTDSMENIEGPLDRAMKRIMQRVGLGLELHQAFEREARSNGLQQLLIISTALHINEQFGGSIRSILDDIVQILRLDDLGKRELKAQTGETRITALVLSLLPIAMLGILLSMNPQFLAQMWQDSLGQTLLVGAAIMQCIGAVSLWRMVRIV